MKKYLIFSFALMMVVACSDLINKPKNLVPKDTMASILAEMAIADQLAFVGQNPNMEAETKFILQKHHVKGTDFTESYKYYLSKKDLPKIYSAAQKIVKDKDPKAADYIDKKMKEQNKNMPPAAH